MDDEVFQRVNSIFRLKCVIKLQTQIIIPLLSLYAFLLNRLYGVRVIGLDLNKASIEWARKHSIGKFYATDAVNLGWIPDNTFDHFFSFAAVYYVHPNDICKFGKEVVRILKPGGTALFGWLSGIYSNPFGTQPKSVWDCVKQLPGINVTIYDDKDLWKSPGDLISNTGSYSVIIQLASAATIISVL